jgi:hypothetical protein
MKQMTIKPTDLPPRPDFGTIGPTFKLRTNFFPIKLPKRTLFEYDITITPSVAVKRVRRRIFHLAEETNDWTQHGLKGKVAHDFSSKLIAVSKLPDPLVIKIIFSDEDEDVKDKKKQKPKEYTLTFKFVKDLDTNNLLEYVHLYSPLSTKLPNFVFKLPCWGGSCLRRPPDHLRAQFDPLRVSCQPRRTRCNGWSEQVLLPIWRSAPRKSRRRSRGMEGFLLFSPTSLEAADGQRQRLHYGFLSTSKLSHGHDTV